MIQNLYSHLTPFPDLRITIDELVAEVDQVAGRFMFRGTHRGELLGIAPTDKQVTWTGMTICRLAGGRIAVIESPRGPTPD